MRATLAMRGTPTWRTAGLIVKTLTALEEQVLVTLNRDGEIHTLGTWTPAVVTTMTDETRVVRLNVRSALHPPVATVERALSTGRS